MPLRARDIGNEILSDSEDEEPDDPSEIRSEQDYSIQPASEAGEVVTINKSQQFGNGIVVTIGTIIEDFTNGFCRVSRTAANGQQVIDRAYLGFYRARRGETVILHPATLELDAKWIVGQSLVGEIKYAGPTASELNAIGSPPIDDYYASLTNDDYI